MDKKLASRTLYIAVVWVLVAVLAASGATWAWFTFYATTNVTELRGTIGGGKALFIANDPGGPFDRSCELRLSDEVSYLEPISTADLDYFYRSSAQDDDGISFMFYRETEPYSVLYHGYLYLKCEDSGCFIYFSPNGFNIGSDAQVWASARLGMKITTVTDGTRTLIFRLDSLGNTGAASSRRTTDGSGVISRIREDGSAVYVADPSRDIARYFAGGTEDEPTAGEYDLCYLTRDEIATVEFFVWLEGCDDNCYNPLLATEIPIELAFAGT